MRGFFRNIFKNYQAMGLGPDKVGLNYDGETLELEVFDDTCRIVVSSQSGDELKKCNAPPELSELRDYLETHIGKPEEKRRQAPVTTGT